MPISLSRLFLSAAVALCSLRAELAAAAREISVSSVVNDVKVTLPGRVPPHTARTGEAVAVDSTVCTGNHSRAELNLPGSIAARLGAGTIFRGTSRDLVLERGTLLLQVPKSARTARVRAARVTAAVGGTALIESLAGSHLKALVLEGSLHLSLDGRVGESVVLTPGKMVIISANETRMPRPVAVDLGLIVKTSALVDPVLFGRKSAATVAPLRSLAAVQREVELQGRAKAAARLAETNLVIQGGGTSVMVLPKDTMQALDAPATAVTNSPATAEAE